jgi:lipopolysaccharide transport system ATP-binding protein
MDAETLISFERVGVAYQGVRRFGSRGYWALEDVSLELRQGETLGVIGRNGAGKSTLLRVAAGILKPDRGRVVLHRPLRIQLLALGLGFVPHLTGRDNSVLSGMLLGMARADIERRLPAIREYSDLGDFFDQPLNCYSNGMVLRLGFSVAMQAEPDVLLIDEVLGVGDAEFLERSSADIHKRMRSGMTCMLVSHQDETIRDLCDRVVWVEHGRSQAQGPTVDVLVDYHASPAPPPPVAA